MEALGRPKFTNLKALMYITLHVLLKEELCDFQQKWKYVTVEPGWQLDENSHCTKLDSGLPGTQGIVG